MRRHQKIEEKGRFSEQKKTQALGLGRKKAAKTKKTRGGNRFTHRDIK